MVLAMAFVGVCLISVGASCIAWNHYEIVESSPPVRGTARVSIRGDDAFGIYVLKTGAQSKGIDTSGLPVRTDAVMFYETDLGLFPRIHNDTVENGGTPVGMDLVKHLRKVREDVEKKIPDASYSGLAVIDYESRGMLWRGLGEGYRELVYSRVRAMHPRLRGDELEDVAKAMYNEASKRFIRSTVGLCRQMRPNAKWGFYYFPSGKVTPDDGAYEWLIESVDALYPSVYPVKYSVRGAARGKDQAPAARFENTMTTKIANARAHASEGMPVYVFVRSTYHEMNKSYDGVRLNADDARSILVRPVEAGADGVIFWSWARLPEHAAKEEARLRALKPVMNAALRRDRELRAQRGGDEEVEGES